VYGFAIVLLIFEEFPPFVGSMFPSSSRNLVEKCMFKILVTTFTITCTVPAFCSANFTGIYEVLIFLISIYSHTNRVILSSFITHYRQIQIQTAHFNSIYMESYGFKLICIGYGFGVIFCFAQIALNTV